MIRMLDNALFTYDLLKFHKWIRTLSTESGIYVCVINQISFEWVELWNIFTSEAICYKCLLVGEWYISQHKENNILP